MELNLQNEVKDEPSDSPVVVYPFEKQPQENVVCKIEEDPDEIEDDLDDSDSDDESPVSITDINYSQRYVEEVIGQKKTQE